MSLYDITKTFFDINTNLVKSASKKIVINWPTVLEIWEFPGITRVQTILFGSI